MSRYKPKRYYVWSSDLAYCLGLITTDGCLSKDLRPVDFTSKDLELVSIYRDIIKPTAKIGEKLDGHGGLAYRVQISDVALYDFLVDVGLTSRKSKVLTRLEVPDVFYADFLRGCFDGDGTVYGYVDSRWRGTLMYYTAFASASPSFLQWLRDQNQLLGSLSLGYMRPITENSGVAVLSYAKEDSRRLYNFMYYGSGLPCLTRKRKRLETLFARERVTVVK